MVNYISNSIDEKSAKKLVKLTPERDFRHKIITIILKMVWKIFSDFLRRQIKSIWRKYLDYTFTLSLASSFSHKHNLSLSLFLSTNNCNYTLGSKMFSHNKRCNLSTFLVFSAINNKIIKPHFDWIFLLHQFVWSVEYL
jgi:hypothetical protein